MRKLGERTTQCKPLIAQLKTVTVPQKRTRFSDTDENRFRIGDHGLFGSSASESRSFRAGDRSLFPDSEDSARPPSDRSIAETVKLPLVRLGEPRRYREIRSRIPSRSNSVGYPAFFLPDRRIADRLIKSGMEIESKVGTGPLKRECETQCKQEDPRLKVEMSANVKRCKDAKSDERQEEYVSEDDDDFAHYHLYRWILTTLGAPILTVWMSYRSFPTLSVRRLFHQPLPIPVLMIRSIIRFHVINLHFLG